MQIPLASSVRCHDKLLLQGIQHPVLACPSIFPSERRCQPARRIPDFLLSSWFDFCNAVVQMQPDAFLSQLSRRAISLLRDWRAQRLPDFATRRKKIHEKTRTAAKTGKKDDFHDLLQSLRSEQNATKVQFIGHGHEQQVGKATEMAG